MKVPAGSPTADFLIMGGTMESQSPAEYLAIHALFVRYTVALDEGDVETVVGCFTEDGVLESPAVGRYAGEEAVRLFAERFARFKRNGNQLRHMISNLAVAVEGNAATARCYLAAYVTRDRQTRLLATGHYECRLACVRGEWRFAHRLVVMDADYTLEGI
jgi:ketosteroid isomerase-like protein